MLITAEDFEALTNTRMQWAGYDWQDKGDRFSPSITFNWTWAYWVDDAASIILAKNFLYQREIDFEAAFDEATGNYIIVTDYCKDVRRGITLTSAVI